MSKDNRIEIQPETEITRRDAQEAARSERRGRLGKLSAVALASLLTVAGAKSAIGDHDPTSVTDGQERTEYTTPDGGQVQVVDDEYQDGPRYDVTLNTGDDGNIEIGRADRIDAAEITSDNAEGGPDQPK
ncbi:MAG: hypothetical protein U5L95_03755 [Candidatus Saccharibacteria bacterium]|nr:hypothetical protein [Candidatus Saccharibacteria bacterium]